MSKRNTDWAIDEWIILLDLYLKGVSSEEIAKKYRKIFIALGAVLQHNMTETYRNHPGINRRIVMFKQIQNNKLGRKPIKGLKLVWDLFHNNPTALQHACNIIYSGIYPLIDNLNTSNFLNIKFNSIHEQGFYVTYLHNLVSKPIVTSSIRSNYVLRNKLFSICPGCKLQTECNDIHKFKILENHYKFTDHDKLFLNYKFNYLDHELYCPDCHYDVHNKDPWINLHQAKIII